MPSVFMCIVMGLLRVVKQVVEYLRDYISQTEYTDYEVSKRLPAHMSSTRTELYAILEGLHIVSGEGKPVYIFTDSQSALYELINVFHTNSM